MKGSGRANYDYIVLQATENSIPFYESMGFVRVGAVTESDEAEQNKKLSDEILQEGEPDDAVAETISEGEKLEGVLALPNHFVTSDLKTFTVKKAGTTLNEVAKRFHVDVWDIVFLNDHLYGELPPGCRLLAGTMLYIPNVKAEGSSENASNTDSQEKPQYYVARENDTPRMIAKKFKVNCLDLVEANKVRLPGLLSGSRLKQGTKVKVSHLDVPTITYKSYSHWSFPDDQFEEGDPSYMMVRKLCRRRGNAARERPFLSSLAVPVSEYEPPTLLLPLPCTVKPTVTPPSVMKPQNIKEPKPPKKPMNPYFIFAAEQRETRKGELQSLTSTDRSKYLSERWKELPDDAKAKYIKMSEQSKVDYEKAKLDYERELASFRAGPPADEDEPEFTPEKTQEDETIDLFNKVVKLKPGAITEGSDYKYW